MPYLLDKSDIMNEDFDIHDLINNMDKYMNEYNIYKIDNCLYTFLLCCYDHYFEWKDEIEFLLNNIDILFVHDLYRTISCLLIIEEKEMQKYIIDDNKLEIFYNMLSSIIFNYKLLETLNIHFTDLFKYIINKYNSKDFCKDTLVMSLYSLLELNKEDLNINEEFIDNINDDYIKLIIYVKYDKLDTKQRFLKICNIISKYKNIYDIYDGCYSNISNLLINIIKNLTLDIKEPKIYIINNNYDIIKYINIHDYDVILDKEHIDASIIAQKYVNFILNDFIKDGLFIDEFIFDIDSYISGYIMCERKTHDMIICDKIVYDIRYNILLYIFDILNNYINEHELTTNRMLYNEHGFISKIIGYFMHNNIFDIYVYFNNYDYCEKYFKLMEDIEVIIPNNYIHEFKRMMKRQTERYLKKYIKMQSDTIKQEVIRI